MRESFIFYKSFYNSIKELDPKDQVQIYNAIFEYQFENKEIELQGVCKSIFTLIIPQLEANNKRYENGKKGGRPKTKLKPKQNQTKTKTEPNVNDNVNVNENDNENLIEYVEHNFGRTLNPIEYETILNWEDNELTRHAIKEAMLNNAYSIKYIQKILNTYKDKGYKTIKDIEKQNKKVEDEPYWLDMDLSPKEVVRTKEEQERYDEFMRHFE